MKTFHFTLTCIVTMVTDGGGWTVRR